MQDKDTNQVLKYGDKVVLRCQEDLRCFYLMAKSPKDQQLYVVESEIKQPRDKYFSFSLYNIQAQMIFQVYPKLLHEAAKRYLKLSSEISRKVNQKDSKQNLMQDKSNNLIQDIQTSLLRKRMETEEESNLNMIKSHKGQPVEYGNIIMLYHSLTSSFMLATNKTIKGSAELTRQYSFCLDRKLSSSMYFTIQPDSLAFDKKTSAQVKLYEQFQLLTFKQMTMPRFSNLLELPSLPQISNKSFNYDHDDTFLTLPLIMENQFMFKYYKAYHKIAEADTKEEMSQNALSVMIIPTETKDRNTLYYGQFIRIKFYKQNVTDKKNQQKKKTQTFEGIEANKIKSQQTSKGYISSSINAIGLSPQVFLQIQDFTNNYSMEKVSSIFQIVPESDQSFGKPVILNVGNQSQTIGFIHLTLRHLLSGKILKLSKRRKLILSNDLSNHFMNNLDIFRNSSQVNVNQIQDPLKSKQQKNMPSIKLYRDLKKTLFESPSRELIIQGQDSVITGGPQNQQFNKSQNLMDNKSSNNLGQKQQILFVMKLGQSSNVNRSQVKFSMNNFFNMASFDSQSVVEVELGEGKEIAYQEKLTTKFEKFTNYCEEASPDQKYQKVIRDEFCIILPNFEQTSKRLRFNLSAQEKEIIIFIEEVEKILASKKIDVGHFKQVNYTFMHTFANLNPLKMSYYDINGSEESVGSNFLFEIVPEQEIKDYNEVLSLLSPLVILAKHPISFAIIRYQGTSPFQLKKNIHQGIKNPSQSTSEKILCDEVQAAQNQAITNIQAVSKSIEGLQSWLCGNQNEPERHINHQDPLPMRQTIFREMGIIDLVVKILYEMYIHGWLENKPQSEDRVIENGNFSSRVQNITEQGDNIVSTEINLLSDSISNFLLMVVKESYENSLYVVQWYLLFKQILLEGKLIDSMRLDLLLMSLFQQTEINITFQFEVESLAKDASFQQFNKHAYNLLISFCLHSSYRTRESLEELLNQIFSLNKDTIFAEFNYNSEQRVIQLRKKDTGDQNWINITQAYNEVAILSSQIMSPKSNRSPFQFFGTQFTSRVQASEYMLSCVRLMTELSKSNPSMMIKHISCVLPFMACVRIISDLHISPVIRTQILDFLKSSYMQHDFRELRTIAFPQFIKFKNKQSENKILNRVQHGGLQNEDAITYHFYFSQKKISDIYKRLQSKYLQKSDNEDQQNMNIQEIVSVYIDQMLDGKSIHDIKTFEHQYLQQLLRTFILIFSKGLFISIFQKDEQNFTKIYAQFIKFLKTSVTSATNSEPQNKSVSYKAGNKQRIDPIVLSESDDDSYKNADPSSKSKTYIHNLNSSITRNIVWLDELIDIINLLEQYQQNLLLDKFVQDSKTDKIFDEFSALEGHKSKNKQKMINKLKDMKSQSSHFVIRGKARSLKHNPNLNQAYEEDHSSNKELFDLVQEISKQKKQMILDFSNKIAYGHENIFDQLAELLCFNQTRLSAAIIDLLWTIYTTKSTFLSTINNLCVINAREHSYILNKNQDLDEKQRLIDEHSQESIYTEFTAIFWRIHFALTALSGENSDPKNYDTINDALSDILMIFFPDYAAKTDIQNFIELNQMDNEERHHGAYEQPIVKSKLKQEMMVEQVENQQIEDIQQNSRIQEQNDRQLNTLERIISLNYEDKINNNFQQHLAPLIDSPFVALKRVSKFVANVFDLEDDTHDPENNTTLWKIHHSLSIDVSHICYRQKILRYLGFHELIKKIFDSLIQDTNGNIFRERNKQKDQQKNKQWDIMNEVLEKSTMFLLFFVLRNEENQEIILKDNLTQINTTNHRESSCGKNNYLQLLAETENKQFQLLVYNLMVELFKNNYQILFNLERHTDENGIIGKLFKKFEHNLQKNNLESCIYFLQFIPSLIKIKDTDIIQNNEIITQLFKTSKLGIISKVQALLKKSYNQKIEQNLRGSDTPHQTPRSQNQQEVLGTINMPLEICFLTEFFNITRQIGCKSPFQIDDFAKSLMPIQLIQEAIQQLDEWYPLKLSIILYFQQVYLDNSNQAGQDEKNEMQSFIMDCVFKQLTKALTENQSLMQNRYNRVILNNPLLFNVLQQRTFFSSQEVLYKLDYEHTAYLYTIYGVIEVIKNFIKQVVPECIDTLHHSQTEQVGIFDEQGKEDLLFISSSVLEVVVSVQNFLSSHPEQSSNHYADRKQGPNLTLDKNYKDTKDRTSIKPKHTRIMTKKMNTFAFQNKDFEDLASEDSEVRLVSNDKLESLYSLRRSLQICIELQQSSIAHLAMKKVQLSQRDKQIFQQWEAAIQGSKKKLIDESYIQNQKELEIQKLVSYIVTIKDHDNEKFKNLISSMIVILSEDIVSSVTKQRSITILRKLSNYKEDLIIAQSILSDLGKLGYTDFLCDLICAEENNEQKLEYIKGFVEYLDDSSFQVQIFFYDYLVKDHQNSFLICLQSYLSNMFDDIKLSEKGRKDNSNKQQKSQLKIIIDQKINSCISILELLRLGCENHYTDMQNFYRNGQTNSSVKTEDSHGRVNLIVYVANLFEKYSQIMNEYNPELGQKMIDFLIELVQGPCIENQEELCQKTRILEVLEEVNLSLKLQLVDSNHFTSKDLQFCSFRYKIFLLQLSMMEGNTNEEIPKRISQFFNPQLLLERIEAVYYNAVKITQKNNHDDIKIQKNPIFSFNNKNNKSNIDFYVKDNINKTFNTDNGMMEFMKEDFYNELQADFREESLHDEKLSEIIKDISVIQCDQMVNECFLIYILLKKLKKFVPQIQEFTRQSGKHLNKAINYFRNQTSTIEIINMHGKLEKVYFPIPRLMQYLSAESKISFLESVSRESIKDKINGLLNEVDNFCLEMEYYEKLHQLGLRYNNTSIYYLRNLCLIIAFTINILLLINEEYLNPVIQVLAVINVIFYGFILFIWCLFRMSLEYQKISGMITKYVELLYPTKKSQKKRENNTKANIIWTILVVQHMTVNSYTFYWIVLVILGLLGILHSPLYFGFLLLDIIDHSVVLKNVIRSLTLNYKQLLMTALLGILIFYLYSIISFQSDAFRQTLQDNGNPNLIVCYTSFQCFIYMMHQGLRANGGIGDDLVQPDPNSDPDTFSKRVVFDLSFYLIVNVIMLNIIFGIIIDTFAELRDEKNLRGFQILSIQDYDSQNKCFICNLSRSLFEKEGISFDKHITKQHYIWSYLAYLIHLKVKDERDLTGIESYVWLKIGKQDISWLPILRAVKLEDLGVKVVTDDHD